MTLPRQERHMEYMTRRLREEEERDRRQSHWNTIRLNTELKDAQDNIKQLQENLAYMQNEINELKEKTI